MLRLWLAASNATLPGANGGAATGNPLIWGLEPSFDGVATLLSVAAAIVVFWIGFWQNQITKKQQLTLQIMLELLTNERFSDANVKLMKHVESAAPVDPATVTHEEDLLFMSLLSMYEFISINFLTKKMDRKIILRQRKSGLAKSYVALKSYIEYKREKWDRPHAYRSFEVLVTDFIIPEYQKLVSEEVRIQDKFAAEQGALDAPPTAAAAATTPATKKKRRRRKLAA